jgi:aryl-alcohol dehydrogenase-like predicted oxidoreductase
LTSVFNSRLLTSSDPLAHPDADIEEGWATLAALREEGKVRHNGVTGAIVGVRRLGQVRGVISAAEFRLSPREAAEVSAFFARKAA